MERIKEGIRKGNGGSGQSGNAVDVCLFHIFCFRRCDLLVAAMLPLEDERRARLGRRGSHDGVLLMELVLVMMIGVH